ncbi:MAG: hypothetical protein ABFD07_13305 [Methanobacterium sp.]
MKLSEIRTGSNDKGSGKIGYRQFKNKPININKETLVPTAKTDLLRKFSLFNLNI